jgi:predicted transcriptional regulator
MPSATVRISDETHGVLKSLSGRTRRSMQSILDEAVREYRKKLFWEQAAQDFEALRANEPAWQAELDEQRAWDVTSADGLEETP